MGRSMRIGPGLIEFARENPVEAGLLAAGMLNVPVVSDAAGFAGDVLGMVNRPEDRTWTNAGLAALGLAPGIPALGALTFGGKGAKTADMVALARAQDLEKAGGGADEIWRETGWGRGADGEWRFEVDDSDAFLESAGPNAPEGHYRLQHDNVQDSYPEMWGSLQQSIRRDGSVGAHGSYRPSEHTITVRGDSGHRSTALHEVQHAIQQREGFAEGGASQSFVRDAQSRLADLDAQVDWVNEQLRLSVGTPDYDRFLEMRSDLVRQIREASGNSPYGRAIGVLESAHDQYRRLAGEVEARNVQHRMDWTPEQRRETPPWVTEDVPRDQQIVWRR